MSGQDEALVQLKNNLTELSELLSIEREATTELTSQLSILESKIINLKTDLDEKRIIRKMISVSTLNCFLEVLI